MELQHLFDDDEAVSPVIGVILMVAITVILAAVIATFVLGLGEQVSQSAPSASFATDYTDDGTDNDGNAGTEDWINFTHESGDSIESSTLTITSDTDFQLAHSSESSDLSLTSSRPLSDLGYYGEGTQLTAGNSFALESGDGNNFNSATFRVVWNPSGGGDSATIKKWEGPDA